MAADAVAQFKQQRRGKLGDRLGAVGRDVADVDALFACSGDVDDVVAGGQQTDEAHARTGGDDLAGKDRLVGEDDLGVADALDDEFGRGAVMHGQLPFAGEVVPAQVAGVQGCAVKYHDFHVCLHWG